MYPNAGRTLLVARFRTNTCGAIRLCRRKCSITAGESRNVSLSAALGRKPTSSSSPKTPKYCRGFGLCPRPPITPVQGNAREYLGLENGSRADPVRWLFPCRSGEYSEGGKQNRSAYFFAVRFCLPPSEYSPLRQAKSIRIFLCCSVECTWWSRPSRKKTCLR